MEAEVSLGNNLDFNTVTCLKGVCIETKHKTGRKIKLLFIISYLLWMGDWPISQTQVIVLICFVFLYLYSIQSTHFGLLQEALVLYIGRSSAVGFSPVPFFLDAIFYFAQIVIKTKLRRLSLFDTEWNWICLWLLHLLTYISPHLLCTKNILWDVVWYMQRNM